MFCVSCNSYLISLVIWYRQGRIMVPMVLKLKRLRAPRTYTILSLLANVKRHGPSVCLSVVSVTFVHPTQAITIFGNVSTPFGTTAIYWHPGKILRRSSQGTPLSGELNSEG